jgi:membrane protein
VARQSIIDRAAQATEAGFTHNAGWRRWGEVVVQAAKDFLTDSGPQWAAAIAYYSLLSTIPLLLAAASVAAYFISPITAVEQVTQLLGEYLPGGEQQVARVAKDALAARGGIGLLSFGFLLWSGTRVLAVVTKALNIAYDADEPYGFWKRTLIELAMLATIGVLFIAALSGRWLIRLLRETLAILSPGRGFLYWLLAEAAPLLLLLLAFFLLYRFVPRRQVSWRAALFGAGGATLLFLAARPLFLGYLQEYARHSVIYGSIAFVISLVLWAWIVAIILLYGGELASHCEAIIIKGKASEEIAWRHQRRAPTDSRARDDTARHASHSD